MTKINTPNSSRDSLGVGGIINPNHEGPVARRPVEDKITNQPEGAAKVRNPQPPKMNNPGFLNQGENKA